MKKQGLLVVSFGTSHLDTLEKTIGAIEGRLGVAFPDRTLRRAFTSGMIMNKLRKHGVEIDDVPTALGRLVEEGYTDILVQPTHMMHGDEYEKLVAQSTPFFSRFDHFAMGAPLFHRVDDFVEVAQTLVQGLPPKAHGVSHVLMGHGSTHFANSAYAQLDYHMRDMGRGDIHVGTVEGYPELPQVMRRLEEQGEVTTVHLYPLMIVAGDHAKNDLAGAEEDSWKSQLEGAGYTAIAHLVGLGEYEGIGSLFVAHAKEGAPCE